MESQSSHQNKALTLLSAIAAGDAAIGDIAAELKKDGIDSVEAMLTMLREGTKAYEAEQANVVRPLNIFEPFEETPTDVSRIVQRVPEVPFILNGTVYDPSDITRFNGHELHFVPAPDGDHMLVIDDRDVIATWWQMLYLDIYRSGGGPRGRRKPVTARGAIDPGVRQEGGEPGFYLTYFCEHKNCGGSFLLVWGNTGYSDLTNVCMSGICPGNWNDKISSMTLDQTHVAKLWEHTHWRGQSFTFVTSNPPDGVPDLHKYGWGDRASGVETW